MVCVSHLTYAKQPTQPTQLGMCVSHACVSVREPPFKGGPYTYAVTHALAKLTDNINVRRKLILCTVIFHATGNLGSILKFDGLQSTAAINPNSDGQKTLPKTPNPHKSILRGAQSAFIIFGYPYTKKVRNRILGTSMSILEAFKCVMLANFAGETIEGQ